MASQIKSALRAGQVLEISFPTFTPRITVHCERELTVKIIAGDNAGFRNIGLIQNDYGAHNLRQLFQTAHQESLEKRRGRRPVFEVEATEFDRQIARGHDQRLAIGERLSLRGFHKMAQAHSRPFFECGP